jgi:4-amino-4-deoxy-L-arabinose transferase-like glycosyltransferase
VTGRGEVWSFAGGVALMAVAAIVYTSALGTSPPYLMHDELQFSLQSRSIADSGHDLAGRRLPVFFTEPEFPAGRDPVIVYVTASVLKVVPFSEGGARLATALVGLANIALMFFVARALSGDARLGLLAALLLAFTPIHFIRARLVLSPLYSIPFILGWLIALSAYLRSGSRRALLTGTALIALSVYTYLACTVMAPLYFVMTWYVAAQREGRKVFVPMAITAAIVLTPLLIWSAMHPERYSELIEAYRLYGSTSDATPLAPANPDGPRGLRLWVGLVWQFLNPDFLFLSGDSSMVNSTRMAGLFPIAFAGLILAGLWAGLRSADTMTRIVVGGLVTAPLASVVSGAIEINRIMFAIPFAVLVANVGAATLIRRGGLPRAIAVVLIASVPIQFASFHRDYVREYPARAGTWFGGNVRGAVRELLAGSGPSYMSGRIQFANRYWAFYAPQDRRGELQIFQDQPPDSPAGGRAACQVTDRACAALQSSPDWRQVSTVREINGEPSFAVFERR